MTHEGLFDAVLSLAALSLSLFWIKTTQTEKITDNRNEKSNCHPDILQAVQNPKTSTNQKETNAKIHVLRDFFSSFFITKVEIVSCNL